MPRRSPELLVLALDIGSSSTRSALFDERGRVLPESRASREYALHYTADGGAELPPLLLRRAVAECLGQTMRTRRASPALRKIPIAAIGASAFWHSLLGLDREGRALTPIYTWADSRCSAEAMRLRGEFDEKEIHARTGCMLRASFWPAKLRWLRRTQKRVFSRVGRWVSPAEWIFEELFGATGCSHSMASATGLYNLETKGWDSALGEACGLEPKQLADLTDVATVKRAAFPELREAKCFTAIGDGAAGNLGCGADAPGRIAINIGTSAAVRVLVTNPKKPAPFGLFRYAVESDRAVIGGAVSNAGNLRRWCVDELRIADEEKALSRTAAACDPLTVLPFWVGERAPTWPENLHGAVIGLSQASSAGQILRATTCAVFYRLSEILELIETCAGRAREVIVSGGVLRSPASLRLLADALGRDLQIATEPEASLRGAAAYVLKAGQCPVTALRKGAVVRHDRALAKKHRIRAKCQIALEDLLSW
jgi:gluconokinase